MTVMSRVSFDQTRTIKIGFLAGNPAKNPTNIQIEGLEESVS
jgi:hypothetical protein